PAGRRRAGNNRRKLAAANPSRRAGWLRTTRFLRRQALVLQRAMPTIAPWVETRMSEPNVACRGGQVERRGDREAARGPSASSDGAAARRSLRTDRSEERRVGKEGRARGAPREE